MWETAEREQKWWNIHDSDIQKLEDHLRTYVKDNSNILSSRLVRDLPSYRRWYFPSIAKNGDKLIIVSFMHKWAESRARWLHIDFGVMGGGDSYWHAVYNIKYGKFENTWSNADASRIGQVLFARVD